MTIADEVSVHPRLRGELINSIHSVNSCIGSSPLTRGTQTTWIYQQSRMRFIPAYAGNSVDIYVVRIEITGSSPLTRGTRKVEPDELIRLRFIPAYAGNSFTSLLLFSSTSVHPRLRGELTCKRSPFKRSVGSSPLTRGTRFDIEKFKREHRFIPAYAGNSRTKHTAPPNGAVHPRLRGELRSS